MEDRGNNVTGKRGSGGETERERALIGERELVVDRGSDSDLWPSGPTRRY